MKTLEQAILYAVERGEFVHLSVISDGKGFRATFASASRHGGYAFGEGKDPVQAMVAAIEAAPMVRKPVKPVAVDDEALG